MLKVKKTHINVKTSHVCGLEENIVKMSMLPKMIHRSNAIPIKSPMMFFAEIDKAILKFTWDPKVPQLLKTTLKKKKKL